MVESVWREYVRLGGVREGEGIRGGEDGGGGFYGSLEKKFLKKKFGKDLVVRIKCVRFGWGLGKDGKR